MVERVCVAARACHVGHCAIAHIALIVIRKPCVDISCACRELPAAAQVLPRDYAAEGLFALTVVKRRVVGIVRGEHWQLAVRVYVPSVEAEAIAITTIVVGLLQYVQIFVRAAAVNLLGVVLVDDVHLLVVDVLLLIPIYIFVLVG